jgi:phosphoenolpyruvate carboxylase
MKQNDRSLLREDIRFLGRLLAETLKHYEGERLYETVEAIRQAATRFSRAASAQDARSLERLFSKLSPGETVSVVRAFSYFSRLVNIAEDQDKIRALRCGAPGAFGGGLEETFSCLAQDGSVDGESPRTAASCLRDAGADRAPDRGAAQEHPRYRARDRAARRCALPRFQLAALPRDAAALLAVRRARRAAAPLPRARRMLAKTDMAVARRYAGLANGHDAKAIFARISAEYELTRKHWLAISGQRTLLESNPELARNLLLRRPYIESLNQMQVELIKRYRQGQADDRVKRAIYLSINGVSAGLRKTG